MTHNNRHKRAGILSLVFPILLWVLTILTPPYVFSQSQFDTDEELVFDQPIEVPTVVPKEQKAQTLVDRWMEDTAFTLGYQFSHGTDHPQKTIDNNFFLRLEQGSLLADRLYFKLDGKAFLHTKNDHLTMAKNSDVFIDGNIRELYLQPGFEDVTLTLGKQISVWGKADTKAVTDVLSPRDMSQFIFVELEDSRTGQWMASASIYADFFNTFVFVCPYPGRDREPENGSRYHRQIPGQNNFTVQQDRPQFGDMELGFKLDKTISKTDASIMAGRFYSNAAVYHATGALDSGKPVLEKTWPDYYMAGAAAAHAWQSFLFKLELAYKNNFPLQGTNTAGTAYVVRGKDLIDAAVGLEYNANDKYLIYLELSNRYLLSGNEGLIPGTDKNSTALYTSLIKKFFNDTLEFEYIFFYHPREKNNFHHFKLTYDLTDNIELKGEYAVFNAKDPQSLMWPYRDEDRIGLEIRYFF